MDKKNLKKFSTKKKFDVKNIHSVELNLLDGQVELILRALELFGYNLQYMVESEEGSDESRREKMAKIRFTYQEILSAQASQVASKSNNVENLNDLGKCLLDNDIYDDDELNKDLKMLG